MKTSISEAAESIMTQSAVEKREKPPHTTPQSPSEGTSLFLETGLTYGGKKGNFRE